MEWNDKTSRINKNFSVNENTIVRPSFANDSLQCVFIQANAVR